MSTHTSLIDQALVRARGRVLRDGLPSKVGSAPTDSVVGLVKEASDVASAMEYVALDHANDGTEKAAHQVSMIRNFLKSGSQPAMLPTEGGGTQAVAPQSGKTTLLSEGGGTGGQPQEYEAAAGSLPRNAMEQPAPATAPTHTAPPSGGGTSKKASLFDMMMGRFDQPVGGMKTAAHGGPIDLEAGDGKLPPKRSNENSNIGLLESNTAPANATRRQAKAPTRARLKKLFAGASDTTGDQTVQAIFPNAFRKGGLKVASSGGTAKEASARDWSAAFIAAKQGSLGEEAQAFASFIEQIEVPTK